MNDFTIEKHTLRKILSLVRGGDFAHPGEEEAMLLSFQNISKNKHRKVIDIGCGLGGTAAFVQNNNYGNVVGIDINQQQLAYARLKYPYIPFFNCDVMNLPEQFSEKFQLIYLFNSFYAFLNQKEALKNMANVADKNAILMIFDYVQKKTYKNDIVKNIIPYAIDLENFKIQLKEIGWAIIKLIDISHQYKKWYVQLVMNIRSHEKRIIEFAGKEAYHDALRIFTTILSEIEAQSLGGIILHAQFDG